MSKQNQTEAVGPRICAQLAAIMAAVDAVGKERRNSGQGFNYRGIEDIMDALHPIFAEHKVFILSEVLDEKTEDRTTAKGASLIYRVLKTKVSFVSGEDGSRESVLVVGEGMDSGDKAANKAMSAALKYALTQTLILPYGQVDADEDTPPESRPKADAAAPTGARRSAYDGRTLQPGESPLPPAGETERPKTAPPHTPKPQPASEPAAFHGRLYDAMALVGVSKAELKALLVAKGAMTGAMEIDNLPERTVALILDGKDKKIGRDNWDLIVDGIKKERPASSGTTPGQRRAS